MMTAQAGNGADVPSTVYFHGLPILSDGTTGCSQWWYWSLDPEPTPGPWPKLALPGIELICECIDAASCMHCYLTTDIRYVTQQRDTWVYTPLSVRGGDACVLKQSASHCLVGRGGRPWTVRDSLLIYVLMRLEHHMGYRKQESD